MGFNEFLSSIFGNKATRDMKEIKPWVDKVKAAYPEIAALDNDALRAKTEELKAYIRNSAAEQRSKVEELKASVENTELEEREELFAQIDKLEKEILDIYEKALDEVLPAAFSIVKETAKRFSENEEITVTATEFDRHLAATKDFVRIEGDKAIYQNHWVAGGNDTVWNMVHYDVQLFGGVVLHKGKIAEMATGEGKTLVATLPVFLNALTGNGVHVVTVNDYLAKRDSEWMGPLYMFHGLSVDCIDKHQPNSDARRQAYLADITFGTNNEFGFDYLRDNMAISPKDLVQRQHNYAIVDEVDSVLIDDARTPLIISGPVPKGDDQLFEQLRPQVERLVEAQKKLATQYLADAKRLIASNDKKEQEEGFLALYRSHKCLPKNKALIKFLSEQGIKAGMLKTEEIYMEQNNKRMHEVTEPLYFVIDEKLNSVDLTDKGVDLITGNSEDPTLFVLPDITSELSALENEKDLDEQQRLAGQFATRYILDLDMETAVLAILPVGRHERVLRIVEIIQKTLMKRNPRPQDRSDHQLVVRQRHFGFAERRLHDMLRIVQRLADLISHHLAGPLQVAPEAHTVALHVHIAHLRDKSVENGVFPIQYPYHHLSALFFM